MNRKTLLSTESKSSFLTVKSILAKVVGWVCIVFFLFCAITSFLMGQGSASPSFLLFVALGILLILLTGELSMNSEEIIYITPLAEFQIRWDEVEQVEMDAKGGSLVFYAADRSKRLAALGPYYWSGTDKQKLTTLLNIEMGRRHIAIKQTPQAAYTMSKNTKV